MIGQTISHYKILEKPPTSSGQVGEVPTFPTSLRMVGMLSISRFLDSASIAGFWEAEPLFSSGSGKGHP
jgi:hypothetical protein